jgi:acyl dehydratase
MSEDWSSVVAEAGQGIGEVGKTATLHTQSNAGTTYDPTVSETPTALTVVQSKFDTREIDGTVIRATDIKLLVSANGAAAGPSVGDFITVDNVRYRVEMVWPVAPGDTVLMWKVQLRG